MTITEKVAYLKGLFDGMSFDPEKQEGKLIQGMLDVLEELAASVTDLHEEAAALGDEVDDLYDEVEDLADDLYEDEDDECDCCDVDGELYQVVCPTCEEEIYLDEDTLDRGKIQCPACGEELEFDLSELEDEDDDDVDEDDD